MGITDEKFREFYEKYKNLVLRQAYDMTRDYYLAQDICQETFLKLYDYREYLDEYGVKQWLCMVSYHKACDSIRRSRKRRELMEGNGTLLTKGADNPADRTGNLPDDSGRCGDILQRLREKNEQWYEILILSDYLGVPRREIAKRMGIPISTVDTYLRRCRKWLKENFSED